MSNMITLGVELYTGTRKVGLFTWTLKNRGRLIHVHRLDLYTPESMIPMNHKFHIS